MKTIKLCVLDCTVYKLLLVSCICAHPSSGLDIYVSKENGTLDTTCWTRGRDEPCQTLSLALAGLERNNHTTVWIEPGTYHLLNNNNETGSGASDAHYKFYWMQDLAIVALNEEEMNNSTDNLPVHVICSNVSEDSGAGLTFFSSANITIRGILFDGCGVYVNSTSRAVVNENSSTSRDGEFFEFFTALYFVLCSDVVLEYVHVNGTSGIGMVMYSTVGSNRIKNCNFSHNAVEVNDGDIPGGGGVYIEFSYCLPDVGGQIEYDCDNSSNVPAHYTKDAYYAIESTTFYMNNATVTNATRLTFILPHRSDHVAFGRGGGLSVFFKGSSFNNTVLVSDCLFTDNQALWGAGLFVEYQDNAHNNTIEINSSIIDSNACHNSESEDKGTGGGGARIGYIFFNDTYGHVRNNSMTFSDVQFIGNKAYYGGGLSFYTAREPASSNPTNSLTFIRCRWQENVARLGSAADISVWHPIAVGAVVKPSFTSCVFFNNSAVYTSVLGSQVGVGALFLDSVPVSFLDEVRFISNTQTALASISTGIYFEKHCRASFVNNTGRNGGAIALMGYSFIRVSEGTEMNFVSNSAEIKGGAIFAQSIGEHDLISSRNCFIRYEDIEATPLQWEANFTFDNNTVADGNVNSIYVTSLLTCLWGGAFGSTETIKEAADKVFCWSDRWLYHSSGNNCSQEIATSPACFTVSDTGCDSATEDDVPMILTAIPGKRTFIDIRASDDRDNDVTNETVFTARLLPHSGDNIITLDSNSLYISDRSLEMYGEPGANGTLRLETIDPRVISTEVNITLQSCPPGLIKSGQGSSATCQCAGDYGGYVICNGTSFTAEILRGSWIGSDSKHREGELLVGQCPYCFLIGSEQYIQLPQNVSRLPEFVCEKINRTGALCGQCLEDYGPVVNDFFQCVPCSSSKAKYHWIFYLLTEYLPIVIFFFVIIFFNVSATSGPANAFVFFAQVITTAFSLAGGGTIQIKDISKATARVLNDLYTIPYDIWNLNFFHPFLPKFCLSSKITTLQLQSTGYITALFPLLLVVILYLFVWLYSRGVAPIVCLCRPIHHCFARFRGIWNLERSVLHALATFLLLSYTKFSLVSFYLLTPTPLLKSDGNRDHFVLTFDGTIDFFSHEHVPYIVVSFIVLLMFVLLPPLILMLPSLSNLLRLCLQKVFKYEPNLLSYQVGSVTGQFMRAFHECYKDGTGGESDNRYDFRWFAGMYFILRLMVFTVLAFTPDTFMQYTILQFVCIGGFLAFALLRPYKNDWYNKLDATIFAILVAINTLSMYNYFLAIMEMSPSVWIFSIQYVLILCPLIYIVIFVVRHLFKKYGGKVVGFFKRKWPFSKCIAEEDNQDFIEYTEETGRLRGDLNYSINIAEARNRQRSIQEELQQEETQALLLQDPSEEAAGQNSGNSNGSSGYGATGSAKEGSPGLSENSEKDDCKLQFYGVEQMRFENSSTVQERRKRLFRTQ